MVRKVAILCVLSVFCGNAPAEARDKELKPGDVFIPRAWRIQNTNGNCVWCATETICRQAGLRSIEGVKARAVREGWHGSWYGDVEKLWRDCHISYRARHPDGTVWEVGRRRDGTLKKAVQCPAEDKFKILHDAVAAGTGAYIEIPGHALVVVGIDSKTVRLINNNGGPKITVWTRGEFNRRWSGCGLFPRLNRRRPRPDCPDCKPLNPSHPSPNPEQPVEPPDDEELPPPKPVKPSKPSKPKTPTAEVDYDKLATMIAAKVPAGAKGDKGDKGDRGPIGPQGKDGASADSGRVTAVEQRLSAVERDVSQLKIRVTTFEPSPAPAK